MSRFVSTFSSSYLFTRAIVLAILLVSASWWAWRWPRSVALLSGALPQNAPSKTVDVAVALGVTDKEGPGTPASERVSLFGALVGASLRGVALISVDGKPARPYRVGDRVVDGWLLQSVSMRDVSLVRDEGHDPQLVMKLELVRTASRSALEHEARSEYRLGSTPALMAFPVIDDARLAQGDGPPEHGLLIPPEGKPQAPNR